MRPLLVGLAAAFALAACATDELALSDHDGFDDTDPSQDGKADASGRTTLHRFADRRLFPEGGAYDPVDRAFYTGSLEHGTITRVVDGVESTWFAGTGEPARYTLGMQVDAERRRLWVCTTKDSLGSVWIFDLATGARLADVDLRQSGNPEAACNDVLLDGDTALVSDRENTHIYKLDEHRQVTVWAHDKLLGGTLVSLNSLVFTPDHSAVITAVYLEPSIVRISTANPRDVRAVKLSGDLFMDGFNVLNGPDDLMMVGDELIVAFGSSLKRVTPTNASWSAATVRSTKTIGGVTALVQAEGKLYGVNGQSVRFALKVPPNPFEIFEIDVGRLR